MKWKLTGILLAGLSIVTLVGCRSKIPYNPGPNEQGNKTELKINFAAGNALKKRVWAGVKRSFISAAKGRKARRKQTSSTLCKRTAKNS